MSRLAVPVQARSLDLPMPAHASTIVHAQTGLTVHSGLLRFRVVGMDQAEYVVGCLFLGDPITPHAGPKATAPRALLQPLAVIDGLRFTFEDNRVFGIPHGEMVIEKK